MNLKSQISNLKFTAVVIGLSAVLSASSARGQASFPMLMALDPLAVQAGDEPAENKVTARYNLAGAYRVFITGGGVAAEPVVDPKADPAKEATSLKLRFTADKDAQLGVREFRVAAPQGLSTVGQLVVVRDPVFVETKDNNTLDKATPVSLPAAVCGVIEAAEDVDCFKFAAKVGQALSFHCRSARVEDKIHDLQAHSDPIIAVKNSSGTVLAASDNYFFADPAMAYTFKQDGDYFLEIRDVRYQGNAFWQYCVEINDRPLPATAAPLVIAAGKKQTVELAGLNLAAGMQAEIAAPAGLEPGLHWLTPRVGTESLPPVPMVVAADPITAESNRPHGTAKDAEDVSLPTVVAGRIDAASEADCYAFAAKAGDAFEFEVTARRAQSSLDSVLAVYDESGKRLTESDDQTFYRLSTSDSIIESFVAKTDGRYVVEVRDLHQRGGPDFTYALKMRRGEPSFTLHADVDKVPICGETGGCVFVRGLRKHGFAGDIELTVEGLPPEFKADCGRILAGGQDGVIVFSAAKGAKPAAAELRIVGRAVHKAADGKESKLSAVAVPWQEIYSPGGGRASFPVETFFAYTAKPLDVTKVTVAPTEVKLKPGASQKIEVTIDKAEGFEKSITLDVLFRHLARPFGDCLPKGVTIDEKQSKLILSAKETKGYITLKAAPDAPAVENQLVPVMAQAAINFVMKMSYCGDPLRVSVTP
jgi:hypothetical protein